MEPPLSWVDFSENELVSPDVLSGLAGVSLEQPHHWHCEPSPAQSPDQDLHVPQDPMGFVGKGVRRADLRGHPASVTPPSM